jgi:predicted AlkP superfamily phosphohydrolase/phosphomutase
MKQKLIGRKVKGFKFEDGKHNGLAYGQAMDNYIGKIGTITRYRGRNDYYQVVFNDDFFFYPAELIEQHLVDESESNPLDNLPIIGEGVLMEVSDDGIDWVQKYVFAKYGRYFLAVKDIEKPLIVQEFNFCRPIVKTKITRAEFESKYEIID